MTASSDPGLPEVVARWRDHSLGVLRARAPSRVRLRLEGELSRRPRANWTPWRGTQEMSVDRLGFTWRARVALGPLIWVVAFDALSGSSGNGGARLWGILPAGNARGPEVTRTQLLRNLAELVFVPWAADRNDQIAWQAQEHNLFLASARVGAVAGSVQFELDDDGGVRSVSAPDRPVPLGDRLVPAPWRMLFSDPAAVGGIRIPRRTEGTFDLPDGPWTYWRSRVIDVEPIA